MTERVEQQICTKFCITLDSPPWKLFGRFRRLQLWATGDWQRHHSNAPTHAPRLVQSVLVNYQIIQVTQPSPIPLQPRFGALWLLAFPKIEITFEREEISDYWWDSGKYNGAAEATSRTVWGPKVPVSKGIQVSLSYVQCFLYLVSSSINVYFSYYMDGYFLDRPHVLKLCY